MWWGLNCWSLQKYIFFRIKNPSKFVKLVCSFSMCHWVPTKSLFSPGLIWLPITVNVYHTIYFHKKILNSCNWIVFSCCCHITLALQIWIRIRSICPDIWYICGMFETVSPIGGTGPLSSAGQPDLVTPGPNVPIMPFTFWTGIVI